jgi:hypothetical protein
MNCHLKSMILVDEGSPNYLDGIESQYRLEKGDDLVAFALNFEDARRLVACWNACEGISTENLEDNSSVKVLAERYNKALRQRDELLEALIHCSTDEGPEQEWLDRARAAIVKAAGEQA